MVKLSELKAFDAADHLKDRKAYAAYLQSILEEGDMELFYSALGDVAKARGMSIVARETGMSRESLYRAFRQGKKPQFETVLKVTRALDLDIGIRTVERQSHA